MGSLAPYYGSKDSASEQSLRTPAVGLEGFHRRASERQDRCSGQIPAVFAETGVTPYQV